MKLDKFTGTGGGKSKRLIVGNLELQVGCRYNQERRAA